jgi:hypothetical protein
MKTRIYIAGKVTGEGLAEVTAKFGMAQKELEAKGYSVINPLAVTAAACESTEDNWLKMDWTLAMKLTVAAMMTCDEVYMLRDWKYSRGAIIEHGLAENLRMPITYQN